MAGDIAKTTQRPRPSTQDQGSPYMDKTPALSVLRFVATCILPLLTLIAWGCGESPTDSGGNPVVFFAAASTQDVVSKAVEEYSSSKNVSVSISAGATSLLARQLQAGAPGEIFLSADGRWADAIEAEGLVAERVVLLTNRLVLIVPVDSRLAAVEPADLAKEDVRIAIAGDNVPAGEYARQALAHSEVFEHLSDAGGIIRGHSVRTVLAYVQLGEVDAGIVYATDAAITDQVKVLFHFSQQSHEPIEYHLVLIENGKVRDVARGLYDYLQSSDAEVVFKQSGFGVVRGSE